MNVVDPWPPVPAGSLFGLENLRVVDASVMPAVPSGNINAAVIALAEKAADMMKGNL